VKVNDSCEKGKEGRLDSAALGSLGFDVIDDNFIDKLASFTNSASPAFCALSGASRHTVAPEAEDGSGCFDIFVTQTHP